MKLLKISYKDTNLVLDNILLNNLNLIVGKNATGKSRLVANIDLLTKIIQQKREFIWGGEWDILFKNNAQQEIRLKFSTSYKKNAVTFEKIWINDREYLTRNAVNAKIRNIENNVFDTIFPPADKLTFHSIRDTKKYPYLEEIIQWATSSFGFKFGNISPFVKNNTKQTDLLTAVEDMPNLFKKLSDTSKKNVIDNFNQMNYQISNITTENNGSGEVILFIKENGITNKIPHYKLSQGMFRTLAVIIYLEYLNNLTQQPGLIVIDDLCEGLDYDRARRLGKFIFDTFDANNPANNQNLQVIVTSNDNFLMDLVNLDYLSILQRNGKQVSSLNIQNSKPMFDRFEFTGLSNFDLLSSNFIYSYQNQNNPNA